MRFKKLRIAWSVFWGLACVLLVVLCVRSYWHEDSLSGPLPRNQCFTIQSSYGWMRVADVSAIDRSWRFESVEAEPSPLNEFAFINASPGFVLVFPQWLPIMALALLAPVPWVRRFRLRTLLIATTLFALLLGLVVYASSK